MMGTHQIDAKPSASRRTMRYVDKHDLRQTYISRESVEMLGELRQRSRKTNAELIEDALRFHLLRFQES